MKKENSSRTNEKKKLTKNEMILLGVAAAALIAAAAFWATDASGTAGGPTTVTADDTAQGLEVTEVQNIAAMFVEDGSDDVLGSVLTVTVKNSSDRLLQYAKLELHSGDTVYNFEISTIPAGESVRAMELGRAAMPDTLGECTLTATQTAWSEEPLSLHTDELKLIGRDRGIVVENISANPIEGPIYVYYKNYTDGVYVGGITYRASVDSLDSGASAAVGASHYDPDASKIMFVTYASGNAA